MLSAAQETAAEGPTSQYYEEHAEAYVAATLRVDMSDLYERFLRYLPGQARILDAGSGSGRDALAFLERGYDIDAFDASPSLCALSTKLTGIRARVMRFQDFAADVLYDGIWACASLLHVPAGELRDALRRLTNALKPGGALYMSFKYGSGERFSEDGRFYLDMDEPRLRSLLADIPNTRVCEVWLSEGEGDHKGKDAWLNAILVSTSEQEGHG